MKELLQLPQVISTTRNRYQTVNVGWIALKPVILIVFFWFSLTSKVHAGEILIATGLNHDPPYVYGDNTISSRSPGVTIEILRLIETECNLRFKIEKRPWKRIVEEVKHNVLDGGFHFSFKEKRRLFVAYPINRGEIWPNPKYAISVRSYLFYKLKGASIHWNGETFFFDSKNERSIGAIRGGSIIDKIRRLEGDLVEVNKDSQLIKLLLAGRIQGFIALDNMIDPKVKALPFANRIRIEKVLPAVTTKPYYLAFSKKFYREHPDIAWKIWDQISQLKTKGVVQTLFEKYSSLQ